MAGDWIKMRGALVDHPKVIAIARALHSEREFRDWLTPGGGGASNGQLVSDAALRAVTVALLLKVWSGSREHGRFVDDDLHLPHSVIADLDQMAGAPGVGEAMATVLWAVEREGEEGIFLPNFKEFNVPMTPAEKQREYRKRQQLSNEHGNAVVTQALPRVGNKSGTRVEERRSTPIVPESPKFSEFWKRYPGPRKIAKSKCLEVWIKQGFETVGDQVLLHVAAMSASPAWKEMDGKFIPAPLTYLNQRRFEDGLPDSPRPRLVV